MNGEELSSLRSYITPKNVSSWEESVYTEWQCELGVRAAVLTRLHQVAVVVFSIVSLDCQTVVMELHKWPLQLFPVPFNDLLSVLEIWTSTVPWHLVNSPCALEGHVTRLRALHDSCLRRGCSTADKLNLRIKVTKCFIEGNEMHHFNLQL